MPVNSSYRRIFDVFLYNGEFELLLKRLEELYEHVDFFVIVESNRTFTGKTKKIINPKEWQILSKFFTKIRYVLYNNDDQFESPWDREKSQRNSCVRGLRDLGELDLVLLSDLDEFPKSSVIDELRKNFQSDTFGLEQSLHYFRLNYVNVEGPEVNQIWTVAFTKMALSKNSPEELRLGIRNSKIESTHIKDAGWHFSYFMSESGVIKKIQSFSHQELNSFSFLKSVSIEKILQQNADIFNRTNFKWKLSSPKLLPNSFHADPVFMRKYTYSYTDRYVFLKTLKIKVLNIFLLLFRFKFKKILDKLEFLVYLLKAYTYNRPIIICPYVQSQDKITVIRNFRLNSISRFLLPVFFWQDKDLIGPERAYEHCWSQFPDRDVVIIHTDMQPMPNDFFNFWYFKLIYYSLSLGNAGIIACNLLYPKNSKPQDGWFVQSGGGGFDKNKINLIGGGGKENPKISYTEDLKVVREVEWVTFGGILIQRRLLRTCGKFDSIYKWAFVMDVDYSLNARLAGFNLYQVPVSLIHEESKTTSSFMKQNQIYARFYKENHTKFDKKWGKILENWNQFDSYL